MAERSSITQITQIGAEVTPGTAVAATQRLSSLDFSIGPVVTNKTIKPKGYKVATRVVPGEEHTEADITSDIAAFTDIVYPLASVIAKPTITLHGGGTLSHDWAFTSQVSGDEDYQTYTIEHGSSVRAESAANGAFTDFGMTWDRNGVACTAKLMAQLMTDPFTLTPSVPTLPLVPFLPAKTNVFLDATGAALGTTKLLRCFAGTFALGTRYNAIWPLDSAQPSWAALVEQEMPLTLTLTMEADAQGMALLSDLRLGDTKFIEVDFAGDIVEAAIAHSCKLQMAGEISGVGKLTDSSGVYGIQWTFTGVADPTWGKAINFLITNGLSAL